ncbi:MAG TPA: amidohydrolase family protein [Vicinamibacterales bacterium]|jgi:N-acetylglucosamine-6-phosphate deacetylase
MRLELPGLFDLQVNGFGGIDFNGRDLTAEDVTEALERMRLTGVTRCLPTLITSSFEDFATNVRVLTSVDHPAIAGIHMEGPYVSPSDGARGAHSTAHVLDASVDDFKRRQDAARGRIALVTLAPEVPGALALVEHLVAAGVRVAIGHTAATPEQLRDGIAAGATIATHLGNGCPQMLPRHPNVIWELLAADDVYASVIADGHHLPSSTLKSIVRAKGVERTILVTDAISAAGCSATCPPKLEERRRKASAERRFTIGDVVCELAADGRVSLPGTPYLAGSSLTLDRAIANTVRATGLPIETVVPMATAIPAGCLGMTPAGTVVADWNPATYELRVCDVAA